MPTDYPAIVKEQADSLFNYLKTRFDAHSMQRVLEAYDFASQAHIKQMRKSGEPYILHPIAVATIVGRDLELGPNLVITALLHDVVEDTPHTIDEIRNQFGDDVATLVNVLTKKRPRRGTHDSGQIDNFRRILESVRNDVRALLVKLADRLHNMRTLDSMTPDKQMKIAGETDYFYAPLANRLGLYHIKTELENLSFRYRCPADYAKMSALIEDYKQSTALEISAFSDRVNQTLHSRGIEARTEVRYRMPSSIWRKMRARDCDFDHVEGKHYLRVVFPQRASHNEEKKISLEIYSALTDTFKERPGSTTNYIDSPKENGYQSFHVKLLSAHGTWQEIHIASERMIRESRLGCADEVDDVSIHAWIDKFREAIDTASTGHEMDFLDSVATYFYNDDIMVFTPKGQEVILPKNATAIDFAYEIHSNIGRHASYARINGRLSSIKTVLKRGDIVEIGTSEQAHPNPDWMEYASTYKAQRALRAYFATIPVLPYLRCEKCSPLPGDEVIGFRDKDDKITIHKRNCPIAIRSASRHGDRICEVNFTENDDFLYAAHLQIRGVDRYHLLSDILASITEEHGLNMTELVSSNADNIAAVTVGFKIHSVHELDSTIAGIRAIPGVDEVIRIEP